MEFKPFPSGHELVGEEKEAPVWERNSFVDARLRDFDIERLELEPNAGVEAILEADRLWWDKNLRDKTDEEKDKFIREHRRVVKNEQESAELEFNNLLSIRDELVRRKEVGQEATAEDVLKELRVRNIIRDFVAREKAGTLPWSGRKDKDWRFYEAGKSGVEKEKVMDAQQVKKYRDKKRDLVVLGLSLNATDEEIHARIREEIKRRKDGGVDIEKMLQSII